MANLDVQPKKHTTPWWLWLLALLLVLLVIFTVRSCNHKKETAPVSGDSTAVVTATTIPSDKAGWDRLDRNVPAASYDEITDSNISVRGNDNYGIYSLGENILFETGNNTIRKEAEANLKQLAASINKRFKGGEVRVYGYTDSIGSKTYNKELAEQRAEAVRVWLAVNANIDSSKISLNAVGESQPVASNATAQGRQQNRRVEVAAQKAQ